MRSKSTAIRWFCIVAWLVFGAGAVPAQTRSAEQRAIKFDQFGQVGHCDVTARLDNFAIQLQNQPTARGAIVSYAPEGEGPGTGKHVLEMITEYLTNTRGFAPEKIVTIYGGRNSDKFKSETELWIVEKGARLPKTEKRESNVETFNGFYIDSPRHDDFGVETIPEMGPGIGNSIEASFADMLHLQKNSVGYFVVYSGEDLTPGAWRRLGQETIDGFKAFNLEPSRFKLIFGGQEKESHIQYWILPANAPPPVADAGNEKPLAKTVEAGPFYQYDLGEKNQQQIYSRLSEILTHDKTLRAFLVVRLEIREEATEEAAPVPISLPDPTSAVEEEPPPVDLTKLVEKWRADLAAKHKVGPDRFIVVFISEPSWGSSLSLWIVPKGDPLPNPREDDTEPEPQL